MTAVRGGQVRERMKQGATKVDRLGGMVVFRTAGAIFGIVGLVSVLGAILIVQGDGSESRYIPAAAFAAGSVACYFLARYCFSPDRRLTGIDS